MSAVPAKSAPAATPAPAQVDILDLYDSIYLSIFVNGIYADEVCSNNPMPLLLARSTQRRYCHLGGVDGVENLRFSFYHLHDALDKAGLHANDVAKDYAACMAYGVPPRKDFTQLDLDELEVMAQDWC